MGDGVWIYVGGEFVEDVMDNICFGFVDFVIIMNGIIVCIELFDDIVVKV